VLGIVELTWLTSDSDEENRLTCWRALDRLFGLTLASERPPLHAPDELIRRGVPPRIARLSAEPIGFTRYYKPFRTAARAFVQQHARTIGDLLDRASRVRRDEERIDIADAVAKVPKFEVPPGRRTDPANLLTPPIACLDPAGHFPVVNGGNLQGRRMIGLDRLPLKGIVESSLALLDGNSVRDAFELDVALYRRKIPAGWIRWAELRARRTAARRSRAPGRREFPDLPDSDVEVCTKAQRRRYKRIHRTLEKRLRHLLGARYARSSGDEPPFDALIEDPAGGPWVLIEIKPDLDHPPSRRMAIGQLMDYGYDMAERLEAPLRLAAMTLKRPSPRTVDLLVARGLDVLWFADESIEGAGESMALLQALP
jgi:hypothetical protein